MCFSKTRFSHVCGRSLSAAGWLEVVLHGRLSRGVVAVIS